MMQGSMKTIRQAMSIRAARAALAISQAELSKLTGISKSRLARFETLEGDIPDAQIAILLQTFADKGVHIDLEESGQGASINLSEGALYLAARRWADEDRRRSDRGQKGLRHRRKEGEITKSGS